MLREKPVTQTATNAQPSSASRLRSIFLLLVLLAGLLPSCQAQDAEVGGRLDDSLLLALAAHEQLETGQTTGAVGGGVLMTLLPPEAGPRPNPHRELASWYEDMAVKLDEEGGPAFDYVVAQLEEQNRLAADLDAARVRQAQRGRGFQRLVRGVARTVVGAPLKVVRAAGIGVREIARFAKTVTLLAADQVPQLARDYIQRKIRMLGGLLQGRIDLAWDKIAERLGFPFAAWLRSRIDPAFVRLRNRIVARAIRGEAPLAGPARDPAAQAAAAELEARAQGYEQAGRMLATCQWPFLWNYAGSTFEATSIPVEVSVDLSQNTLTYTFEFRGYYEDFKKCDYTLQVEGAGVLQEDDPWFQGTEKATAHTVCTILNTATGERLLAEDTTNILDSEIAGAIDDDLRTLSLCYAEPLGGINAMLAAGKATLLSNGWCTSCALAPP